MIWSRLKSYKCPSCNSPLKDIGLYHACTKQGCPFSINKLKFDSIVAPKPKRYAEPDRSGWDIKNDNENTNDERDN